ncbi:MAG: MerR family DNA-binding transcriptional regulator [Maritimibacter sp.]|nr:MerR family DNA-binding transcriptional regulator [Maritimibacter sp.]
MTETLNTIREMCDTFGVTARTLRFYEAKELLSPRREGQKRLYTRRDRARLKLILRGKRFGFPLEEIRQLLDLYDIGDQQKTQFQETMQRARVHLEGLRKQRDEIDEAIQDLSEQIDWGARMLETRERGAAIKLAGGGAG